MLQRVSNVFAAIFPEAEQRVRCLVPDTDPIRYVESGESGGSGGCPKALTHHPYFIPILDLDLDHLPLDWRDPRVLQDIRDIAKRVVKLRVCRFSLDRPVADPRARKYGHHGSGFVTFDSRGTATVHTSKHVVLDPFEAEKTQVTFFCDGPGQGIKCQGSSAGFKSVWSMDYSSFTLVDPLPEEVIAWRESDTRMDAVTEDEATDTAVNRMERIDRTFSWRVFSLRRLLYRQSREIDVVIISHPHGMPKQVSLGKMTRRHNLTMALYSAHTCPGSSGAPVVRLSHDYMHYVAAGQFVHHGYDGTHPEPATGMGSLRPPFTILPYHRTLDKGRIRRAVALLYEPVSYWALYVTEFMEVEGILFNCTDNFCYFLTLYGFFCGWADPWTRRAFVGFLLVIFCQLALHAKFGARFALLYAVHLSHVLSMHWITWLVCALVPRVYQSLLWVAPLWLLLLWLSRSMSVSHLLGLDLFRASLHSQL